MSEDTQHGARSVERGAHESDSEFAASKGGLHAAIERAADGQQMTQIETDQLTEFFLGANRKRPGEGVTKTLAVNLAADPESPVKDELVLEVRSISWEEWDQAQQLAQVKGPDGVEITDGFIQSSIVGSYAIVKPDLAQLRARLPGDADGKRPDLGSMLRDFFRRQPGGLIQVQNVVLRMSRITVAQNAVREVDAAKT